MTATGAWFTDSKEDVAVGGEGTFGKVAITSANATIKVKEGDANTIDKLVPGCTLTLNGEVVNGSTVKVYYRYKIVATIECADAAEKAKIEALFADLADYSTPAVLEVGENVPLSHADIQIPTTLGNGAMEAKVTLKLSVQFTQFDHQTTDSIVWANT